MSESDKFFTGPAPRHYDQIVFSGGGTRCFWHGGFMQAVTGHLGLAPERIAAVSGGALAAACFIADRQEVLRKVMGEKLAQREYNISVNWDEIQDDGLTPHQRLYHETVSATIDDDARQAIADGPQFQVLLAHPMSEHFPKLSTLPMMLAYEVDLAFRSTPHVSMPTELGSNEVFVDARQASHDGKLIDLICNAAVIPPVFNVEGWEGRPVVDGGMVSKAPLPDPDEGDTLILLTRKFRNLPHHDRRTYVEPSDAVPADKIDFTDRDKIEKTWSSGIEDGKAFLAHTGH